MEVVVGTRVLNLLYLITSYSQDDTMSEPKMKFEEINILIQGKANVMREVRASHTTAQRAASARFKNTVKGNYNCKQMEQYKHNAR